MNKLTLATEKMLATATSAKVMLIGDFCLDVYYHVKSSDSELSLETDHLVRRVHTLNDSPGGAGNVFANLNALGVDEIIPVGVVGDDMFGHELLRLFASMQNSEYTLTIQSEGWVTPTYMKPIVDGKEQERIDLGLRNNVSPVTVKAILDSVEKVVKSVNVVMINQQLSDNIYTKEMVDGLNRLAKDNPNIPFIVDSRSMQSCFHGMWHKLNTHELAKELGIELDPTNSYMPFDELKKLMQQYYKQTRDPLIVSRGEFGAMAYNGEFASAEGISFLTELDTVGAGDSFFSGFALSLATNTTLEEALHIGNSVAGVTVQKLHQTGTCSPEELRHLIATRDLTYNANEKPYRIEAPFSMEVITDLAAIEKRPAIKYAVFDHDGTVSVLREGWEEIMEECMIDAITGGKAIDESLHSKIRLSSREFITRSTGIQTISQMVMLVDVVKKWGLVPASEVKTPQEYKNIYNEALLAFIAKRIKNVREGLLTPADVTVAGSIPFLETLAMNGVKIFLASGTDQDDVRKEAALLGYAAFFTGGIFGSVGDMHNDPKRQVLKNILSSEGVDMDKLVVFGDGPVEMREARNTGALAVGIMSNEIRRYGWNEDKHNRLTYAGANILIPDLMEYKQLASFLLKKEIK